MSPEQWALEPHGFEPMTPEQREKLLVEVEYWRESVHIGAPMAVYNLRRVERRLAAEMVSV